MKLYSLFIIPILCFSSINGRVIVSGITNDDFYGTNQENDYYNPSPINNKPMDISHHYLSKGETIPPYGLADTPIYGNQNTGMNDNTDGNSIIDGTMNSSNNNGMDNGYNNDGFPGQQQPNNNNDINGSNIGINSITTTKTIPSQYLTQTTSSTTTKSTNIITTTLSPKTVPTNSNNTTIVDNKKSGQNKSSPSNNLIFISITGAAAVTLSAVVLVIKKRVLKPSENFQRKLEF
ncbi:hypothetical protein PIROE2DRAFT_6237 [Piromyces sp. E2]|nr:hypothetical protein PIROE2DRAFT_6237 [Piromyces sp. E2]|eukprot:OUM66512.1 hypothetical protein PIROE2DRAFT_6237 [Piromyces sp. E2]